jgi:hypothetical protein
MANIRAFGRTTISLLSNPVLVTTSVETTGTSKSVKRPSLFAVARQVESSIRTFANSEDSPVSITLPPTTETISLAEVVLENATKQRHAKKSKSRHDSP